MPRKRRVTKQRTQRYCDAMEAYLAGDDSALQDKSLWDDIAFERYVMDETLLTAAERRRIAEYEAIRAQRRAESDYKRYREMAENGGDLARFKELVKAGEDPVWALSHAVNERLRASSTKKD
jgi:hypothetical protein